MYARKVEDQILTFQVSGMLWNHSLVMRDLETGSLWSHILGECKEGPLLGKKLEFLPGVMTTWKDWVARYPQTLLLNLDRTAQEFQRRAYESAARYVFGVEVKDQAKAYPLDYLLKNPILNDVIQETPVLIAFEPESTRAFIYERTSQGQTFSSSPDETGRLVDQESGSQWDPWTGRALQGPRAGQRLKPLFGIVSFRDAWETFHPDSLYAK